MCKIQKQLIYFFTLLFILFICSFTFSQILNETELKRFLDQKEAIFEDIAVQMGIANWNVYSEEAVSDQDTPKHRFFILFSNDTLNTLIATWHQKIDKVRDNHLKRRIEIWHHVLTSAKVDMDEEIYKLENQLEAWTVDNNDPEDEPSPEAMEVLVLKLMKLRNQKAKELGFKNYAEMVLEISEIGVDWFYRFVAIIDSATQKSYQNLLTTFKEKEQKSEIEMSDVRKWIGEYYRNHQPPAIADEKIIPLLKQTVENIGFDYEKLPILFVERSITIGGNGLAIHIPTDMRIVVNTNSPITTWMHELGHGLQGAFTTVQSPILKGYEWCLGNCCGAYMEGMAETMARFALNPGWLKKYTVNTDEHINMNKTTRMYAPAYLRFQLTTVMFEIEFYKDLDRDPKALRDELYQKYLFLDRPSDRTMSLINPIYISYPVYLQNYLIADVISYQVHAVLLEKFKENYPFNKNVGEFLRKKLWEKGELYPWQVRIKNATGQELDIHGYLRSFNL